MNRSLHELGFDVREREIGAWEKRPPYLPTMPG